MVYEGKWTEFDKKTGKLNGNLGGWIGKVLSLRGATILQARFEGDGSILRLELSRPKKDPLLFFIEDSGFGLSRECMCTGLTGELGLAGRNQPKNGKKKRKKQTWTYCCMFRQIFLDENELTTEKQTDPCLQSNRDDYPDPASKARLELSFSVCLRKIFDGAHFSLLPLFWFHLSCWKRRRTKKRTTIKTK